MSNRYILKGISKFAERHLSVEDIEYLEDSVGCEIEQSDSDFIFILPDGDPVHANFIIVEQITKQRRKE
ncbi:MAG TPA: hypothetical protein GX005_06930 [Bacteroidales bacterium]|nr:hypothetical protein [Bacteroidales bacterium]